MMGIITFAFFCDRPLPDEVRPCGTCDVEAEADMVLIAGSGGSRSGTVCWRRGGWYCRGIVLDCIFYT
jgi:hypothetical protein